MTGDAGHGVDPADAGHGVDPADAGGGRHRHGHHAGPAAEHRTADGDRPAAERPAAHGQDPRAVPVVARFVAERVSVAVAESLTGGGVCAALTSVPGASAVVRGAVVAYATDLKATLLDVDPGLIAVRGAVDPDVAAAMARGVAARCGADLGLATTGVAGPDPQDGRLPGTVFVAVHDRRSGRTWLRELAAGGDRAAVRHAATTAVLTLALEAVGAAASA